jgi:hypothetical protein
MLKTDSEQRKREKEEQGVKPPYQILLIWERRENKKREYEGRTVTLKYRM